MNRVLMSFFAGCIEGVLLFGTTAASSAEVELRVLVVAVGDNVTDPGRAVAERMLDSVGVPYEVLDSSRDDLTPGLLAAGTRGRFNGIVLTDSETYLPQGGGSTGFDATEFAMLYEYERQFRVREAVLSGYPAVNVALGIDYGMAAVGAGVDLEGRWLAPAGGNEIFEYVNTDSTLPIEGFAFVGQARQEPLGPAVEPLLVDAANPDDVMISRITYPDGRQVLFSSLTCAEYFLHSNILAYEFLNFATAGLFIGARHVYLSVHNDDLFLAEEVWNPETNSNFPADQYSYRLAAAEIPLIAASQRQLHVDHPLARGVTVELAFNGSGADLINDPLTQAIVANAAEFGFINHTYEALQMDWLCPQGGDAADCTRTDYLTVFDEIDQNAQVWADLGLPNPEYARTAVVTDSHSGLSNRLGTEDVADDIAFPGGFNPALGLGAQDLGVRVLASDASRPNQDTIQRVPGYQLVLLPRYPTSLFYNATNPTELVAQYNYVFHERYLDEGEDPCSVASAICFPRTYAEILAAEADVTLRHMLGFLPLPHYFHQNNLHVYDDAGAILQFDWLETVLDSYERWMKLPIESPRFHELADLAWEYVLWREAEPSGWVDTATGVVTLSASSDATIEVTGLAGGKPYGGQRILKVPVSTVPQTFPVDLALDL